MSKALAVIIVVFVGFGVAFELSMKERLFSFLSTVGITDPIALLIISYSWVTIGAIAIVGLLLANTRRKATT